MFIPYSIGTLKKRYQLVNIEINLKLFDIIGYISILFSLLSFISNSKKYILIFGLFSTILFGISISYYSGFNGLFVSFISAITKVLSLKYDSEKLKVYKIFSVVIVLAFYILFNEEGVIGVFPLISLIFIIFADLQDNILKLKLFYYGSIFSWIIYGIALNSIPAILYDIFGLIVLTYSIYKIILNKDIKKLV